MYICTVKTREEIQETKEQITDIMDDVFAELFDESFQLKHHVGYRQIVISLTNKEKFKISTVQSKVLMLVDYLKSQYSHISYEVKSNKQMAEFKHFPLFFYKEITEFKIIITI